MTPALTVDLAALARNIRAVRARVKPAALMLVVKDDAYGLGLAPVTRRAFDEGVRWFGAFDVGTGERVRAHLGEEARIFVWRLSGPDQAAAAATAALDIGVGDFETLDEVGEAARSAGVRARVHLKIDTGLHRNGVRPEDWSRFVERAARLTASGVVQVAGIWSHIAEASDREDDLARAAYESALQTVESAGFAPPVRHLAASAAAVARPEFRYDLVRVGAFCYGIRSAGGADEATVGIEPVAALDAPVVAVEGSFVRVALGSLDGLPSTLAGRASVRTPAGERTIARIGNTEMLVDGWRSASPGDVVRVFGPGAASPTTLAESIDTIGEEIAVISPSRRSVGLVETCGLVVPRRGDRTQLLLVLAAVVSAEEQLAAVDLGGDIGLRAAAVAAVGRREPVVENGGQLGGCRHRAHGKTSSVRLTGASPDIQPRVSPFDARVAARFAQRVRGPRRPVSMHAHVPPRG